MTRNKHTQEDIKISWQNACSMFIKVKVNSATQYQFTKADRKPISITYCRQIIVVVLLPQNKKTTKLGLCLGHLGIAGTKLFTGTMPFQSPN